MLRSKENMLHYCNYDDKNKVIDLENSSDPCNSIAIKILQME